jgi:beta-ribofuranosylaminobenzene 5'-phosphate synthase
MRVVVRAPARLHFGFIDLDGSLGRRFGSIGLAIDEPKVIVEATPAHRLSVTGDESGRAQALARRFLRHYGIREEVHISVKELIPAHVGLGSGTQLALSLAAALARLFSIEAGIRELASVMGRGKRSGIGVAAFDRGGFIVDGGQRVGTPDRPCNPDSPPPVIIRHPFPKDWTFVVAIPNVGRGLAGDAEDRAFRRLRARPVTGATRLSRIVLVQMLPALVGRDAAAFGQSLTAIQRIVGSWFRAVQGGTFASPLGAKIARAMARGGALGVGQSSWGPTVYGMTTSEKVADAMEHEVRRALPSKVQVTILLARADNRGAQII